MAFVPVAFVLILQVDSPIFQRAHSEPGCQAFQDTAGGDCHAIRIHRSKKQKQNQRTDPMKTNLNATSKLVTLLLTVFTLACTTLSTRADDHVPFQGKAEGATTSVTPDPGGVVLT